MDSVFQEEKKKLSEIESQIDKEVSIHNKEASVLRQKINSFVCVDYSDRQELAELRHAQQRAETQVEEFGAYKPTPYFGRMDLGIESDATDEIIEPETVYVGKKGLTIDSKLLVIDWRSPVGQYFYMKTERRFQVGTYQYQLELRRALHIKDGMLVSYNTEFDGNDITLEGDLIDPFLLTVLRDKRRQNRLTDIIRTIQSNQNEIIRKPKNESFVVQGCAGSGKTMILLHRLSYLKFNNRNMPFSGVKIITPNKIFDAHINDLSKELGLNEIERYSVEEYYATLIKRYSSKIDVQSEVASEKSLNAGLLSLLYSDTYFNDAISRYHSYWDNIFTRLANLDLESIFMRFGKKYPNTSLHKYETYSSFELLIREIEKEIQKSADELTKLNERLENVIKQYVLASKEEVISHEALIQARQIAVDALKSELTECIASDAVNEAAQQALSHEIEGITAKKKQLEIDSSDGRRWLDRIQNDERYFSFKSIETVNDEISISILEKTKNIRQILVNAQHDYDGTAFYNFGKRNAIKKQIEEASTHFVAEVERAVHDFEVTKQDKVNRIDQELKEIDEKISGKVQEQKMLEDTSKDYALRKSAATKCLQSFETTEYPELISVLGPSDYNICAPLVYRYVASLGEYEKAVKKVHSLAEIKKKYELNYQAIKDNCMTESDQASLIESKKVIGQLRLSEISRNVLFRDLLEAYKKHGQNYRKENYRHKLFLKLLYCTLYYSRALTSDYFLNVDEAQDLAVSEYKVLRLSLGDTCVFNLYGDVNQLVYSYKGISDWDEISEITSGHLYTLNENYRNTMQITNFCNMKFSAEVYPIGISGDPVHEDTLEQAIKWMTELKANQPNIRVAIIFRYGRKSIECELGKLLTGENVSWFKVNEVAISILSVEAAKGLEFEAVIAIIDGMSENEKYISYTRALDYLSVVRDIFPVDIIEDSSNDELDFSEILDDKDEGSIETRQLIAVSSIPKQNTQNIIEEDLENAPASFNESDYPIIIEISAILKEVFDEEVVLSAQQKEIILDIYHGKNIACSAPSGWSKSVILYLMAHKAHKEGKGQTILTAEAHLQENELVLADRLGLCAGILDGSISKFDCDFKKDKYDVIFVPYDYFAVEDNVVDFQNYFTGKIAYWGVDHPSTEEILWPKLRTCSQRLNAPMFLMSKEGFKGIDISDFILVLIEDLEPRDAQKINFVKQDQKARWLSENAALFFGQGIVYCDMPETCKFVSKTLRKSRINAQAYINTGNTELINYLTNSFSSGGLPVLVTTQEMGKNLTNPQVRFIIHYDVPLDRKLYDLHLGQIGALAAQPAVYDLTVINDEIVDVHVSPENVVLSK